MHSKVLVYERLFERLELLTVSEVYGILCCHEKMLYQWVKNGRIPLSVCLI
jgi:hypothetical protein